MPAPEVVQQRVRVRSTKTGGRSNGHRNVKWFSGDNGFEFVTPDEVGKDLFGPSQRHAAEGFMPLGGGARVSCDAEAEDKVAKP